MPIIGIIASSIRQADAGALVPLQVVTVGSSGSANVTFNNLPTGYAHLQLRILGRTGRSNNIDAISVNFNGDTNANYAEHWLYGDGSNPAAYGSGGTSSIQVARVAASTATTNIFGTIIIDILDFANTNKFKTIKAIGGADTNGGGQVAQVSGVWRNTNAITSITLTPATGTNWLQYSKIALYGIKVA
jgi:hypothetical protein